MAPPRIERGLRYGQTGAPRARSPARGALTLSVKPVALSSNAAAAPRSQCERVLARPERDRPPAPPAPGEEPARPRARRQPERRHHVFAAEQRRRAAASCSSAPRPPSARAGAPPPRPAPDRERPIAAHGAGVGQAQQHQVRHVVAQVAEEAIARAPRDLSGLGRDASAAGDGGPGGRPPSPRGATAAAAPPPRAARVGAQDVVSEEAHAAVDVSCASPAWPRRGAARRA